MKLCFLILSQKMLKKFLPHTFFYDQLIATKSVVDSILLAITSQLVSNLKGFYYVVKRFTSMLNLCRCMKYLICILPSNLRFRVKVWTTFQHFVFASHYLLHYIHTILSKAIADMLLMNGALTQHQCCCCHKNLYIYNINKLLDVNREKNQSKQN